MCRRRLWAFAALGVSLLACEDEPTFRIRVCSPAVIPGQRAAFVVRDGQVVEMMEPDGGMPAGGGSAADAAVAEGPVQIDAIRVVTRNADYDVLDVGVTELSSGNANRRAGFDLGLDYPLDPALGWVSVEALRNSVSVQWFDRRVVSTDGLTEVVMPLTADCFGTRCGFGLSCQSEGQCQIAPEQGDKPDCKGVAP